LKIDFQLQDGACIGSFTPGKFHVGFNDTVHGGILFAALDDVMANLLYLQGIKAHTARCEIRYRRALRVGQTIDLRGQVVQERGRLATLTGEARLAGSGELVADCQASFMRE
jgi:acyl-coenzyme A thioesterase PaaI-like protein